MTILLLSFRAASSAQSVSFTEYAVSSATAGITTGPDGALWFTEFTGNKIGRITTSGLVTEYLIPTSSDLGDITPGPDGALWFTEFNGSKIGRITTSGIVTEFAIPNSAPLPIGITAGPDGALWFTEQGGNMIGRVTTAGTVTEFAIPTSYASPQEITAGPDGALWFTESTQIGRITTSGAITEFPVPTALAGLEGITVGADGALWFIESAVNQIGRITTSGTVTEFAIPTSDSTASGITAGPDGALWFTESYFNQIGRITTSGAIVEFVIPTADPGPDEITAGPDGALWFTELRSAQVGRLSLNSLPNLVPTPTSITFDFGVTSQKTLAIASSDGSALSFTANSSTSDGISLLVAPTNGITPANLTVSLNDIGLPLGIYTEMITITSAAAGNSPLIVPVTINVIAPAPAITSLSPASASAGGPAFTLTVSGSNLVDCAPVSCLGIIWLPSGGTSTFIAGQANADGTQLTATIPSSLIKTPGTVNVAVQAAGGTSDSLSFAVSNPAPVPTISGLSPASATAGGAAFTLTVSGFGFVDCAPVSCLGVIWLPVGASSTFISGQANANGTQLTVSIPAALIATAGTGSVAVQAAGGTSSSVPFIIAATTTSSGQVGAGHLLFPNVSLNALQEFDPVKRVVVNTISLPAPFTYSGSGIIETARIRKSDGGILTNATANENSIVVALSNSGQFVAGEQLPSGLVQELIFDPLDSTQNTVLAGNPPGPNVIAVNPYTSAQSTRISQPGASYTGLAVDAASRIYTGNSATGQIFRYLPDGTQGSLFADVMQATGSSEIGALTIDSDTNVYAAQGSSNRIAEFDSSGSFVTFLTDPGFNQNASVYFNANDGLLYAGNQADDALTILTTAGTPVAVVHMGGNNIGVPDLVPSPPAVIHGGMETTLTGLTFQTPQGGSAPPLQSFAIVNDTSAALSFTTKVTTTSGGSWLSVSVGSSAVSAGQVSEPITVMVNPSGLPPGDYYGLIEIDAAGVANSPQFVQVVLNILAATVNPGAVVTPTGMIFTAVVNGANPPVQTVAVSDVLSRSTSFNVTSTASTNPSWFTFSPLQGTIQPGQTVNIQVQPTSTNLPAGVYSGTLTLQFPQDNVTRQIALLLVVATSATEIGHGRNAPRDATIPCQPTQLLMVFTQLGDGFSQLASWPTTLETLVVDDCGSLIVSGNVTVTFSNGDTIPPLIAQQNGIWSQSWSPANVVTTSLTLTANAVEGGLKGSAQIMGAVQPNPDIPVVNGVASAASSGITPSPGELVAIYGVNLADGTAVAAELPLLTQMQNAFVLLGGEQMPLLYVSPNQINAVVPYGLTVGTQQQAVARHGNRLSKPQSVPTLTAEPAVFTVNQSGGGQGDIYVAPGQILANASSPATVGDTLVVYCTGLGAVNPPVAAGSAAPSDHLTYTASKVSVTIGGKPANVIFAGLSPGFSGLYQINVTVPSGVPTGDQIPFVITVGGISSPVVTMAVK